MAEHHLTHGQSRCGAVSGVYRAWIDMRRRCRNQKHPAFKWYGARGIKVCARWDSFACFFEDMGERPPMTSLDRIDNDGDYTPTNCRWATAIEQQNNKRNNDRLTIAGKTKTIAEWARANGIKITTARERIRSLGWSAELAVTKPSRPVDVAYKFR